MRSRWMQLRTWPLIRWVVVVVSGAVAAVLIGMPTAMFANRFFTRMTSIVWWEYPVWILSSVLVGLIVATFVRADSRESSGGLGGAASGGLLSALAIGCPVCNKLVVMLLGVSGALQIWAPLQPLLGLASVALLGVALARRIDGEISCSLRPPLNAGVGHPMLIDASESESERAPSRIPSR